MNEENIKVLHNSKYLGDKWAECIGFSCNNTPLPRSRTPEFYATLTIWTLPSMYGEDLYRVSFMHPVEHDAIMPNVTSSSFRYVILFRYSEKI